MGGVVNQKTSSQLFQGGRMLRIYPFTEVLGRTWDRKGLLCFVAVVFIQDLLSRLNPLLVLGKIVSNLPNLSSQCLAWSLLWTECLGTIL